MRLLFILFCLQTSAVLAAPRVVTSIIPLQELTMALMTGVAVPEVIIPAQASAHHFALRPSHMQALQQADLVIWIDSQFEAGFQRISQVLPPTTAQLQLLPALDLETADGHIWYSEPLLQQLIRLVSDSLIELDPDNQLRYRENAERLSAAISAWRADSVAQLQGRQPRFITDHDFLSHMQDDLGFAPIATIHDQHHDHAGLRELGEIEQRLREHNANCLFTLESPVAPLARELAQKYQLKIIDLTPPVGENAQPSNLISRLQRLTESLLACS
jgi:zinc transport system substrate-binding protein